MLYSSGRSTTKFALLWRKYKWINCLVQRLAPQLWAFLFLQATRKYSYNTESIYECSHNFLICITSYWWFKSIYLDYFMWLDRYLKNTICTILQLYTQSPGGGVLSRFSHVWLFLTLCTMAGQTPLSMGFSRQEYWNGPPFHPPGDQPNPEIEFESSVSRIAGWFCITGEAQGMLQNAFLLSPFNHLRRRSMSSIIFCFSFYPIFHNLF